jgi:ketosteroid isomerase-like protein
MPPSQPDPITARSLTTVELFSDTCIRDDVSATMNGFAANCVFDSTRPPPDGERIVGQEAVQHFGESFFARSPSARFETQEIVAAGDRVVVRWCYHGVRDGTAGHVRGVDLFRVRDGLVAEKFSCVKG